MSKACKCAPIRRGSIIKLRPSYPLVCAQDRIQPIYARVLRVNDPHNVVFQWTWVPYGAFYDNLICVVPHCQMRDKFIVVKY